MKQFYVKGADADYGPYEIQQLRTRQVAGGTLVREEGSDAWTEASEIAEFASMLESAPVMTEGMHWGDITPKECRGTLRTYSAVLWEIPAGQSWEDACANMPATIQGMYFPHPRCVNTGVMWGEWDVPDGTCGQLPPPPSPGNTIPQCVFRDLWFDSGKFNENGHTYPAFMVSIYVKRTPELQGSCRCPAVGFSNRLCVRVNAFEGTPTNPAQGRWVFRGAKSFNEFSFGTKGETGYTQQIDPLFIPANPSAQFFFEAEFFLKGSLGSTGLPVEPGQIQTTPRGGVRVPVHK